MGCSQSKIENEETVNRCKERKLHLHSAVTSRNKFASAHSSHAVSLKNTGAALSDFALGELPSSSHPTTHSSQSSPRHHLQTPIATPPYGGGVGGDSFLAPPPPLPPFTTPSPLQRAATMPEFSIPVPDIANHTRTHNHTHSQGHNNLDNVILEEESDDDDEEEVEASYALKRRSKSSKEAKKKEEEVVLPMPPMPEHKGTGATSWDYFFPPMENVTGPTLEVVDESREEMERVMRQEVRREKVPKVVERVRERELPPQPPPPVVEMEMEMEMEMETPKVVKRSVPVVEGKRSNSGGGGGFSFGKIFVEIDDCFLRASESAHDVSRMLEAARLHYHSNFADKRGNINHSERVMRVITWNRSFKGLGPVDDGLDDFDSEEQETHATVLDKMLAWEKKLYDEVKAGEQMKLEYQRKVTSLSKLKKRNSNTEALERLKASVSHLHTRYIVDMQSMDSTVSEINRLRDEQLYPKLVALVDGMAVMWESMRNLHETQSKLVQVVRSLDFSQSPKETTDHHHIQTRQLGGVVQDWHTNFSDLMSQQKEYIKALNSWLRLNLIPIDTNWKEKVSSPSRPQTPPIQILILAWQDHLEKIPDEPAKATINNFAAMIKSIWQYQKEELEYRDRVSDSRKDLIRKTKDFEMWYNKFMQKRMPADETDPDQISDKDAINERQMPVEAAKQKLEEDEEAYQRQCVQTREKTLMNLKSHLPELFRSLTEFSLACSEMYSNLSAIARSRNRNDVR